MPEDSQVLRGSENMIITDITLLTIQCRSYAGSLFNIMSGGTTGDKMTIYNNFKELFFQLYLSFKYNASKTGKIKDWGKKVKVLDDLFYNKLLRDKKFMPLELLTYFDAFLEEVINSGIYDLRIGEFHGKGDF